MPPQAWFNYLEEDLRIRVRMTTNNRGEVVLFALQLEVWVDSKWYPVVRYDTAHGEAHIDFLNRHGETCDEVWLGPTAPFNPAFTLAENDLKQSAAFHRERLPRQMESGQA